MKVEMGRKRQVLILTAVDVERDAIRLGLGEACGLRDDARFRVEAGGVGAAAAAASAAFLLAGGDYAAVVCAGIAGGFPGRAAVGDLVVADAIVMADLGAQTADGFLSVDELGFGSARAVVDRGLGQRTVAMLQGAGLAVVYGPVLTVSTTTGTQATAEELVTRIPGAAAEAMEGYGVAVAAQLRGVPMLELRAISNLVGPRDRGAWRIGEALERLGQAASTLKEVFG